MNGVLNFMGYKCVCIVFLGLIFSCQQAEQKPKDVLTPEQMIGILAEVYITEQKIVNLALSPDSALLVFDQMQGKVFEVTGIPDTVFKKSIDYYMERPKELEQIYTGLVDSLQLREQRVPAASRQ